MNKNQKVNMKLICISLREKHIKSSLEEIFCVLPPMTSQQEDFSSGQGAMGTN